MSPDKKKYVGRRGIRGKLFGYIMLIVLALIMLLWLFQVVFFGGIYRRVRISEMKDAADTLEKTVSEEPEWLRKTAREISEERQMCVLIVDKYGNVLVNEDTIGECIVHEVSGNVIIRLYNMAHDKGEAMIGFDTDSFNNLPNGIEKRPHRPAAGEILRGGAESIIYARLVTVGKSEREAVIIVNAEVSPIASTVRTLRKELIIISAVLIPAAALLSYLLAIKISKPIIEVNRSANRLAQGNYGDVYPVTGYREISELSDTLLHAAAELDKTEALQRELIANISHDLRTPLTMITGYAEVMRDLPGESTPENVQIIIDEARRLSSLVNDVLDISRLQAGTQTLTVDQFDLTQTVREVIGRFGKLTDADGYVIRFDCDCNVIVNADRTRILQVVYNFINNAITHSGEDKTVIVTQRIIDREDGSKGVRIEVTDRGAGIEEKDIPYIWDRYYKVDKLHRRAEMGSGLGLSIVKSILELHRADYGVVSEPGVGSTFWFEL